MAVVRTRRRRPRGRRQAWFPSQIRPQGGQGRVAAVAPLQIRPGEGGGSFRRCFPPLPSKIRPGKGSGSEARGRQGAGRRRLLPALLPSPRLPDPAREGRRRPGAWPVGCGAAAAALGAAPLPFPPKSGRGMVVAVRRMAGHYAGRRRRLPAVLRTLPFPDSAGGGRLRRGARPATPRGGSSGSWWCSPPLPSVPRSGRGRAVAARHVVGHGAERRRRLPALLPSPPLQIRLGEGGGGEARGLPWHRTASGHDFFLFFHRFSQAWHCTGCENHRLSQSLDCRRSSPMPGKTTFGRVQKCFF